MSFSHPEVFLLVALVPLLLATALISHRSRGRAWKRLVAPRLRPLLVTSGSPLPRWISYGLALAGLILVIASLAGPNAGFRKEVETIRGRNLLLAIDISRSMLAEDESPSRLAAALAAALEVIDHFPNDRIGLIAFSGTPFLQAPLTIDHGAIRESLQQLDPVTLRELDAEFLPRGGSDLARAVELAAETLQETGLKNNALIVFSDGEAHEGGIEDAADRADDAGVTIFTAGFGSEEGTFIPDPRQDDNRYRDWRGDVVFTRLVTDDLRLLARRTGGFYTRGSGQFFAQNLETAVDRLDRYEIEGRKRQVAIPRFQWFLLPAILFFIASILVNTPWRLLARSATAALAFLCLAPQAEARLLPATAAEHALKDGDYAGALQLFADELESAEGERRARLQLGAGAAAYRLADYARAARAYSEALLSAAPAVQFQAHFAYGNALYHRGRALVDEAADGASKPAMQAAVALWTDALGHYDGALSLAGDHPELEENRRTVEEELEKLKGQLGRLQDQENQPAPESGQDEQNQQKQDGNQPPDENNQGPGQNPNEETDPKPDENPDRENPDESEPGEDDPSDGSERPPQPANPRPGESPEEYARRVLAENADFQSTPLMPHRVRMKRPPKDW